MHTLAVLMIVIGVVLIIISFAKFKPPSIDYDAAVKRAEDGKNYIDRKDVQRQDELSSENYEDNDDFRQLLRSSLFSLRYVGIVLLVIGVYILLSNR